MLKKLFVLIVSFLFMTSLMPALYAANYSPGIYVNNIQLPQSTPVTNYNGLVYVAASDFADKLGGSFSFSTEALAGTMTVGEHQLTFYLDGSVANIDGKNVQAAGPMKIINNRLMVPAGFAAGKLGAAYYWDDSRSTLMVYNPQDQRLVYSVLPGDTLWKVSQVFYVSMDNIRKNNALTSDMLYVGQKLFIKTLSVYKPAITASITSSATVFSGPGFQNKALGYLAPGTVVAITGKTGDWFKADTKVGSGYIYRTVAGIKQDISLSPKSTFFDGNIPVDTSRDTITYNDYTVTSGDSIWSISQKVGLPDYELAAANNVTTTTMLYPGQTLKIPVHNIAAPQAALGQYGQVLDWFKQAQYLFPQGKDGKVIDPVSGKSFMIRRTMGSGHSDSEPLTLQDTEIMKQIFGGSWNWTRKPFILEVDGRRFAVSVSGMPHAGVDGAPLNKNVDGRSGGYGYGPNYDAIAGNGMDGHFDLYFLNGLRHMDNKIDPEHQVGVMMAGGLR